MERPTATDGPDLVAARVWVRIPFAAWLKISGPTFAVMALGFGVLWNGQQATTQRILDLQESTTSRILAMEQSTTDRILEVQNRILELQRKSLPKGE